jgi:hypothetical protein
VPDGECAGQRLRNGLRRVLLDDDEQAGRLKPREGTDSGAPVDVLEHEHHDRRVEGRRERRALDVILYGPRGSEAAVRDSIAKPREEPRAHVGERHVEALEHPSPA